MQSLHALHHGREIQCVQLLQAPQPHQATAVITGGEDSTLRSFVFHLNSTGQKASFHAFLIHVTGHVHHTWQHHQGCRFLLSNAEIEQECAEI